MFKEKKWSNRFQLILLVIIFAAPLVGAYYAYSTRDTRTYTTVNNGEFYNKPQDLADIAFVNQAGEITAFNSFDKKWYVVIVADGQCDLDCEAALNKIARVRAMNGKNLHRIVSLFVHRGLSEERSTWLTENYKVNGISAQNPAELDQWLKPFYEARNEASFDKNRIYLIDPLKKLMMSYKLDVEPKAIFKDLKRLLKVSQVG
jgi:hypothetical protein